MEYKWIFTRILLLLFNYFVLCPVILSQEISFPTSSRSLALGNSSVAITNLEGVVNFNPAGLAMNKSRHLFFDLKNQDYTLKNTWIDIPINQSDFSLSGSFIQNNLGFSMIYRRKGNKNYLFKYLYESSSSDSVDRSRLEKSRRLYHETYLLVSYGRSLSPRISVGMLLRLLYSDTDSYGDKINFFDEDRYAASLDIGLLLRLRSNIVLGLRLENVIKSPWRYVIIDYLGESTSLVNLPLRLHTGLSIRVLNKSSISLDIGDVYNIVNDQVYKYKPSLHFGFEYQLFSSVVVRAGYSYQRIPKDFFDDIKTYKYVYKPAHFISLGAGFKYKNLTFDQAILFNDRRKEILNTEVSVGKLTLKGPTFHYSLSLGYTF